MSFTLLPWRISPGTLSVRAGVASAIPHRLGLGRVRMDPQRALGVHPYAGEASLLSGPSSGLSRA